MGKTKIPWANWVWNPTDGCTKVSQGCKNCYAERYFRRFHADKKFSEVRLYPERLDLPSKWKKPRRIFVDSMSDLFHKDVPDDFITDVFCSIASGGMQHTFMILTKRPERMQSFINNFKYPYDAPFAWPLPNVWLGVSVEDQQTADERIPFLVNTQSILRFLSVEPMLGPIDLRPVFGSSSSWSWPVINWVICGCESGPGARPMDLDWARSLRDQCYEYNVMFFLKQAVIDGKFTKMPGLDGIPCADYPLDQRISV